MIIDDNIIKCKKITGNLFRLIYDGKKFIVLIDGTDKSKTWTKHSAEEFIVEQDAFDRIDILELTNVSLEEILKKGEK